MGSDATISMFDEKLWDEVFIPAVYDLISGKPVPNWVKFTHVETFDEWEKYTAPYLRKIENFKTDCTAMVDFATLEPSQYWHNPVDMKPRSFVDYNSPPIQCKNNECASSEDCHYFVKGYSSSREEFSYLFEYILRTVKSVDFRNVFMGRSVVIDNYRDLLDEFTVSPDAHLRELLDRLANRGFLIRQIDTNEGVQGWLKNEECGELAVELSKLDLPYVDATASSLSNEQPVNVLNHDLDVPIPNELWQKQCLGYLRAFAEFAGKTGRGIVWIN